MALPTVSVVMGVKNAEDRVLHTINSILSQEGVDLEFIIINDGSSDRTQEIIQEKANADSRIRLVSRDNKGLTISLIEGCRLAEGEFIARQDANDISLPNRLEIQANVLRTNTDCSFCSTYVRHVTKEGIEGLITSGDGIIHGSVMMQRSAYFEAGGYRQEFYYAQDIDLWSRLVEVGNHIAIPRIYYEGLLFPGSISGTNSLEQRKFMEIIEGAAQARKGQSDENFWLNKAENLSKQCRGSVKKSSQYAEGAYFIGSCLVEHNPSVAKTYFQEALKFNRRHLRAGLRLTFMR